MRCRRQVVALAQWVSMASHCARDPLDALTRDEAARTALRALERLSAEERRDALAAAHSLAGFYTGSRRRMERRLP